MKITTSDRYIFRRSRIVWISGSNVAIVTMLRPVLIFLLYCLRTSSGEGCTFTLFPYSDAMVFTTDFEVIYPPVTNNPDDRNITLPAGTTMIISCKGGQFGTDYKNTHTLLATCNQNSQFEIEDKVFDFSTVGCVNYEPQVLRTTSTTCGPNAVLLQVGFQIGLNIRFVPQINICFDTKTKIPLYANHNLTKSIGFIKSYLTTLYRVDGVYGVDIDFDAIFGTVAYQQALINRQLGLADDSTKYVDPRSCDPFDQYDFSTPGFCFSKRPVAYRGNFVYIPQQEATYRYINVAPQWYFLDYNLEKLERNVVDFVIANRLDLEVYTGTFGVATFPHAVTGEEVELYLHVDGDTKAFALPRFFWKLIYHEASLRATVFFTVNNPHLGESEIEENVICEDVSDEIKWLTWEKHNATKGYSYACNYQDAKVAVEFLPDLVVEELLV